MCVVGGYQVFGLAGDGYGFVSQPPIYWARARDVNRSLSPETRGRPGRWIG